MACKCVVTICCIIVSHQERFPKVMPLFIKEMTSENHKLSPTREVHKPVKELKICYVHITVDGVNKFVAKQQQHASMSLMTDCACDNDQRKWVL